MYKQQDEFIVTVQPDGQPARVMNWQNERFVFSKNKDGGTETRRHRLETDLIFVDDDFDYLYSIADACEKITTTITDGFGNTIIEGYVNKKSGQWNPYRKFVTLPLQLDDDASCVDDTKDIDVNLYQGTSQTDIKIYQGAVTTQTFDRLGQISLPLADNDIEVFAISSPGPDYTLTSIVITNIVEFPSGSNLYNCDIYEEWQSVASLPNPVKTLLVDDSTFDLANGDFTIRREFELLDTVPGGITLQSAFELLLQDCGLTLISNFFGWNPDGTNPVNSSYNRANIEYNQIYITQLSNVLRPNAISPASRLTTNLDELLTDLQAIEVYHSVENGIFRLEHVSYFYRTDTGSITLDLTTFDRSDAITGLESFEYDASDSPRIERLNFPVDPSPQFDPPDVIYPSGCSGERVDPRERVMKNLYTDLGHVVENTSEYEDEGIFMFACQLIGGQPTVRLGTISGQQYLNGVLSGYHIIKYHWPFNRPNLTYEFDGDTITAESERRIRRQETLEIPGITIDEWMAIDPTLARSQYEPCDVESIEYDTKRSTLTVDLRF